MQIYQEQSSVKSDTAAGTSNAGPSTTKRSIEGTVTVDDGQILVLGGLIEDRFVDTKSKVPLLGDLPLIGALFREQQRVQAERPGLFGERPFAVGRGVVPLPDGQECRGGKIVAAFVGRVGFDLLGDGVREALDPRTYD